MAFATINLGTRPDDGTGDPARTAGQKINANFANAVETTDPRLSDARTPLAHATSHAVGQSDELSLSATQITSGILSAARGGAGAISGILKANGSGVVSQAAAGIDYLSPGGALGSSGQLQYNNAGAFGGTAALVYSASGTHLTITAQAATDVPLLVKGAASQSGNLQEWRSSTGGFIASLSSGNRTLTIGGGSLAGASPNDVFSVAKDSYGYFSLNSAAGGNVAFSLNQGAGNGSTDNGWLAVGIIGTQVDSAYGFNTTTHSTLYSGDAAIVGYSPGVFPYAVFLKGENAIGIGGRDVLLRRDAAGILAQRNSTNAQAFRVYNTYTDASNYARAIFDAGKTTSGTLTIGTETVGTPVGSFNQLSFILEGAQVGFVDSISGKRNTSLGYSSLALKGGYYNVSVGYGNLNSLTDDGYENVAIGSRIMASLTSGHDNVGVGFAALASGTTGYNNMGVGAYALYATTTGAQNTAVGYFALKNNVGGGNNAAIGAFSLGANVSGYYNVGVGIQTGYTVTTGSYNSFIGYLADTDSVSASYRTAIGASAIATVDNSIQLGRAGTDDVYCGRNLYARAATFTAQAATDVPLTIISASGQTANIFSVGSTSAGGAFRILSNGVCIYGAAQTLFAAFSTAKPNLLFNYNGPGYLGLGNSPFAGELSIGDVGSAPTSTTYADWSTAQCHIGLRNGVIRSYQSMTDASNYARAVFDAGKTTAGVLTIGTETAGTGVGSFDKIKIVSEGVNIIDWNATYSGYIRFNKRSIFESDLAATYLDLGGYSNTYLLRDAAGIVAQRNPSNDATSPQAYRIYNSYIDASNYERGAIDWKTTSNVLRIGTEAAGTGTARSMRFVSAANIDAYVGGDSYPAISVNAVTNSITLNPTGGYANGEAAIAIWGPQYSSSFPANVEIIDTSPMAADVGGGFAFGGNDGTTSNRWWCLLKGGKENGTSGNYAGYFSFYTRPHGSTNTERMRITSAGLVTFGGVTSSYPALKPSSTTLQCRLADDSAYAPFAAGPGTFTAQAATDVPLTIKGAASQSANLFEAKNSSNSIVARIDPSGNLIINSFTGGFNEATNMYVIGSLYFGNTYTPVLIRDAEHILAQRSSTNAQAFRVYQSYTDGSNYARAIFDAGKTTAGTLTIGTETAGTGVDSFKKIAFAVEGANKLTYNVEKTNGWQITATSNTAALFITNGTCSFEFWQGATDITMGTTSNHLFNMEAGGVAKIVCGPGSNGNTVFYNGTGLIQFNGTTSSYPALKCSSTTLQCRLADDSAYAPLQGKITTDTAYAAGAPTATGYLTFYDSTGTAYKVPAVAA